MIATQIITNRKESIANDIVPVMDKIIAAVESFDLLTFTTLIHECCDEDCDTSALISGMEMIFTKFKQLGFSRFKSLPGECSCMLINEDSTYRVAAFHTEHLLPSSGSMFRKEFALVFSYNPATEAYSYSKFCAHMDWKQEHQLFIM